MKSFKDLMEIVAPDVKNDLKSLDATSFSKKHGKSKSEIKNTFESAEEKVPEPGREAVGGRFTSRPPKSVMKPAPQVTSEQVELEETMSNDDKSSIALKALVAKKNLKQSEGKFKSVPFLVKMKQRVAAGKKLKEQVEELEEMDKSQDPPGRDGGIQFPPGPKVSKKDIKAVKKDPAKHLSDLFAKEYAKKKMKEETSSGEYNDPISRMRKKDNEQKRNNVTDKSGAVHTPMSRARHLARMAMQKQMTKPVKESLEESRKAQIVREAMKSAKDKMKKTVADEDKFVANPELNSKVIKTASQM